MNADKNKTSRELRENRVQTRCDEYLQRVVSFETNSFEQYDSSAR
jgi:hypothetical protein